MITPGSRLAERILMRKHASVMAAPCDAPDCRLCMNLMQFDQRKIRKGDLVIPDVGAEAIHAWHTDDEIIQFMNRQVR